MINNVELNMTFACNLKCKGCNRLCNLTRLDDDMTVQQVEKFVQNLAFEKRHISRVKLVGGEPTVHPQFMEICEVLSSAHQTGLIDKIKVNTNTVTQKQFEGKTLPPGVRWQKSPPSGKTHRPFLWSPRDLGIISRGPCKMVRVCGMSLDVKGWLPCSAAIAIARLFGHEDLYKPLDGPLPVDAWGMDRLCPDCLFGVSEESVRGRELSVMPAMWEMPSPRWAEALWRYAQGKEMT